MGFLDLDVSASVPMVCERFLEPGPGRAWDNGDKSRTELGANCRPVPRGLTPIAHPATTRKTLIQATGERLEQGQLVFMQRKDKERSRPTGRPGPTHDADFPRCRLRPALCLGFFLNLQRRRHSCKCYLIATIELEDAEPLEFCEEVIVTPGQDPE